MNTTPTMPSTRRSALRCSVAVVAIGLAVPTPPPHAASASDADAELIALCDRLVQLRTYEVAQLKLMDDDDDHDPVEATDAEWDALAARVREIDRPLTLTGAAAMARCVVRHSDRCPDGDIVMIDLAQRMAIRVSEFLAGSAVSTQA
jgi:hypothetical protein